MDANGKIVNGVLTDLKIDTSNLAPKSTISVTSTINLNSTAPVIMIRYAVRSIRSKTETYTKSFSTPIYDTQGNQHTMDQYMVKTGANTWNTYTLVDGRNPDATAAIQPLPPQSPRP